MTHTRRSMSATLPYGRPLFAGAPNLLGGVNTDGTPSCLLNTHSTPSGAFSGGAKKGKKPSSKKPAAKKPAAKKAAKKPAKKPAAKKAAAKKPAAAKKKKTMRGGACGACSQGGMLF